MSNRTTPPPSDRAGVAEWRAYALTVKQDLDTVLAKGQGARKRSNRKSSIINRARRELEDGNTRGALDRLTSYHRAVDNDRIRRTEDERLRHASEYELRSDHD